MSMVYTLQCQVNNNKEHWELFCLFARIDSAQAARDFEVSFHPANRRFEVL